MIRSAVILFLSAATFAGSIQYHWSIAQSEVNISEYNQWDVISAQDGMAVFDNGYPNLPGVPRCYVIPQGTTVTGVEVSNITTLSLGSLFLPSPVMILPLIEDVPEVIDYTEPHFEGLPASFPESQISGFKTGTKTGFRLGSYSFVPFRYSRDSGELFLITSAEINMIYEHDPEAPVYHLTEGQVDLAKRGLAIFVDNPEMLNIWSPATRAGTDDDTEVIVIGIDHQITELSDLVSLHETLGYSSQLVTEEWIQNNLAGYDLPEKIRNHIRDLYENNGLLFAVLVADAGEATRLSELEFPDYPSNPHLLTVTDLYFSDLDGTWDSNGNHLYGEEFDEIDYYSDVYVGRYPTSIYETDELQTMVDKSVQYNTSPPAGDWQKRALLLGAVFDPVGYQTPWGLGTRICDSLATFFPNEFQFDKLYEDSIGNHPNNQLELFNQGTAFMAFAAHGNVEGFAWFYPWGDWPYILSRDTVQYMTNGEKLPWVIGRMSCLQGYIQTNGFAEMLVEHEDGGAVIAATSSQYAFAGEYEPGPAAWVDIYFSHLLFDHNLVTAGVTNGIAKDMFWANWNSFYTPRTAEWTLQSTNLLGDPCTVFISAPQGVENPPRAGFSLSVSPNPVHLNMNVNLSLASTTPSQITVYDMIGRVVIQTPQEILEAGERSVILDVSNLSNGMYIVQLNSEGVTETDKCVVIQ